MSPATPRLRLDTLFLLDDRGRIISTREPRPSRGPAFILIRGATECAWAVRSDIADHVAAGLDELARQEPPSREWERPPVHSGRYRAALPGRVAWGPAFEFPERIAGPFDAMEIYDEALLQHHFSGWVPGEFEAGASPVLARFEGGHPVSSCSCARRSAEAAEAGLETAPAFQGQGHAPIVASAWAVAVRASGRTPLYSTDWANTSSLAVARKLGLRAYATDWSIDG